MATVTIVFDSRQKKKDKSNSTYPIKIRIIHKDDPRYLKTGYSCTPDQWSGSQIKKSAEFGDYQKANRKILAIKTKAIDYIDDNKHRLHLLNCTQLRDEIENYDPEAIKKAEEEKKRIEEEKKKEEEKKNSLSLGDGVKLYMKYLRNEDPDVPQHKKRKRNNDYVNTVNNILDVLTECVGADKPISEIDEIDAGNYFDVASTRIKKNGDVITATTFNDYRGRAIVFFDYLIKKGYQCKNVIEDIPKRKPTNEPQMLELEEFYQLLEKIESGDPWHSYKYKNKVVRKKYVSLLAYQSV